MFYELCVPCQAGLLFSGLPAQSKKKNQKKHFLCNDPLKNFAFDIFHDINIGVAKFYNGLHKKYLEPLVLIF